jgi:hypothetical protein
LVNARFYSFTAFLVACENESLGVVFVENSHDTKMLCASLSIEQAQSRGLVGGFGLVDFEEFHEV